MRDRPSRAAEVDLDALPLPERFLLRSFRAWACCCRGRRLPAAPVAAAFASLGIPAGAVALDAAMTRLVLATARPLSVHCPPEGSVSGDEAMLLAASAAAQRGDEAGAAAALGEVLPPGGAALVARSLRDLGRELAGVLSPLGDPSEAGAGRAAPPSPRPGEAAGVPPTLH